MPIPLMLAWYAVKSWIGTAWRLWSGLPAPVRHAILMLAALGVGMLWGGHVERRRCQARIEASIAAAKTEDGRIAADAKGRFDRQMVEAQARSSAVEKEVKGYVDELAKRTAQGCAIGPDADRDNDGLGMRDDAVQQPRTQPAAGRGHRPDAGAVPARKGGR